MVSKVIAPVIGLFFTTITAFAILAALVYFGNGGGGAGQAAVADLTAQASGLASAVISGVVNLTQAIFRAAMGAIQ